MTSSVWSLETIRRGMCGAFIARTCRLAEHFSVPVEAGVNALKLSHYEMRFSRTLLYFEQAPAGRGVYAVIAKVIVPGVFQWPSTQARPMYDSRFAGASPATRVTAK